MSWGEAALWWLPTAAVAAIAALGLVAMATQPWRPVRKYWLAALLVGGALAIGASAWQQHASRAALGLERARLGDVTARLDELGRLLEVEPDAAPQPTFDAIAAAIVALNARTKDLEGQIDALKESSRTRTIDPNTAAKMAEHLRQFGSPMGSRRVVVSCLPADVEAYRYANQIANVLRTSGWEALGPETTTIFGEAPAMGITLYVRGGVAPPEAVRLLIDAFTRFNIPYQSGVASNDAIPDPATVELFVGRKP
jgi:hypothetical protein